jgi:5'-3' exonuclease
MGIPVYFKTLIQDYNDICLPDTKNINIDNLYFDLNCLIHPCCRDLTDETEMYIKILDSIHKIVKIVKPNDMVYIAIDGPCPKPKMIQQRLRRFKSAKEKKVWDTNKITPGTLFMENLENYLLKNIKIGQKLIFSSSNEHGEGEHKIYDYIRTTKSDNNCVYGLDADLIMLSLISDSKIHLLRETTEYRIEGLETEFVYLDIDRLKRCIISNIKPKVYNLDDSTLINDYIFICFFLGNDFISHTPSINLRYDGLNTLMDVYKNLCERYLGNFYLIDINTDDLINISGLKDFIYELSLEEDDNMKSILHIRDKQEHKYKRIFKYTNDIVELEKLANHRPILDRTDERRIFYDMKYWKTNYYMKYIFDCCYSPAYEDILKEKIDTMCNDYLQSLYWCIHYYLRGCISWRYSYDYYTAPCLSDLHNTIVNMNNITLERDELPYTPIEQLKMVLPIESHNLIRDNVDSNDYITIVKECHILKRYLWESFPILPHL